MKIIFFPFLSFIFFGIYTPLLLLLLLLLGIIESSHVAKLFIKKIKSQESPLSDVIYTNRKETHKTLIYQILL